MRCKGVLGLKFHREQLIDGLFVDLYCHALRACLEIDGGIHDDPEQAALDVERTAVLERRGIRVLRIRNEDVTRAGLERLLAPLLPTAKHSRRRRR